MGGKGVTAGAAWSLYCVAAFGSCKRSLAPYHHIYCKLAGHTSSKTPLELSLAGAPNPNIASVTFGADRALKKKVVNTMRAMLLVFEVLP